MAAAFSRRFLLPSTMSDTTHGVRISYWARTRCRGIELLLDAFRHCAADHHLYRFG